MEYIPIRVSDIVRRVNRDWYLPAIQRELVWKTDRIERLFDSIMADFPIGSFLFWKLEQKNKDEWPVYEFVREYDDENPHNSLVSMAGIQKDITLVLDGQQRITSLFVGLRGSYRYFYYRWRKAKLHLNLLKEPVTNDENPEELTYEFSFREKKRSPSFPTHRRTMPTSYLVGSTTASIRLLSETITRKSHRTTTRSCRFSSVQIRRVSLWSIPIYF